MAVFGCSIYEVAWLKLCCFLLLHYASYCGVHDMRGSRWSIWVSRARSDQDSISAAGGASSLIRNAGVKEVGRKQILYPEKHRQHVQGDVLKTISNLARTSQGHIFFYKVKSCAKIAGNEYADRIAKYQACLKNNDLTDTGNSSAGPGGNPLYNVLWLAREVARPKTPELPSSIPNLIYFPDLKDAFNSHMHAEHRLGYAGRKTCFHNHYQSLLPNANKSISNAFWNMPCVSTRMKRTIFQYRTGTLYNQKHAHPPHSLRCQCPAIRNMVTEHHNIASRMILKVGQRRLLWVKPHIYMDVGSADRLAHHDLNITEQISSHIIPSYLFDPAFLIKLDAPPAALVLSWSLLALLTQIDHLLPPHIGYSAV
eukprot:1145306-Pelagomonas_calceolata.AAC.1